MSLLNEVHNDCLRCTYWKFLAYRFRKVFRIKYVLMPHNYQRCHGDDGKPIDKTIPAIWGQQQGYIYIQLRDFKRGDRRNDIMQPIASSMERDDMLAIAEYFSKKRWPDLGQPRAPKEIADWALRANSSVGCTGCHLDQFQGDGTVPRLAGMSREYLTKTMDDFRSRAWQ